MSSPIYEMVKKDILGKNRTKWLVWLLSPVLGYFLAEVINVGPAPFTIMCGGIVAALLSYLGMETGKESKAKEVEESVFKDAEEQYLEYLKKSNEVIRECEASKGVYFFDQALSEKEEDLAQIERALDAVENLVEQLHRVSGGGGSPPSDFNLEEAESYRNKLIEERDTALVELNEVFENAEEITPEAKDKKEELKLKLDTYLECYHDLYSSLEVLSEVHNRGGEKITEFKGRVAEYDKAIDKIYMDTLNPRKGELVLKHAKEKKKVHREYISLKSEVYRRVEYTSDAYALKNSLVLSVVVGAVFFAAGYNYNYGEIHKNDEEKSVLEIRFHENK